ncbi:MAG: acetyl-coenzyme A synthetase N-terminal domain-containing protein, partial [Anaerolineae bacterium]
MGHPPLDLPARQRAQAGLRLCDHIPGKGCAVNCVAPNFSQEGTMRDLVADIRHLSGEVYYPSPEVLERAYIKDYPSLYQRAMQDLEAFWAERAEELDWYR